MHMQLIFKCRLEIARFQDSGTETDEPEDFAEPMELPPDCLGFLSWSWCVACSKYVG